MIGGLAKRRFSRRSLLRAGAAGSATLWLPSAARGAAPPLVVDIHSHTFNASDLPVGGFTARFIPFLSDLSREGWTAPELWFRKLSNSVEDALDLAAPTATAELAGLTAAGAWPAPVAESDKANEAADKVAASAGWLAASLGKNLDIKALLRRAAQVVNLIVRSRAAITATLAATYPSVGLFVPMLVDYDNWTDDKAKSPLAEQIKVQGALGKKSIVVPDGTGGARVHPFVAFDPRRADGLALVKTAIETHGFIGVKVYPPVGFAPARNACLLPGNKDATAVDAALDALYAYCTANDVPITTHCSEANEFGLGFRDLVAPHRWEPVLQKFKKLRLNLGHYGHAEGVDAKRGFKSCEAWIRQASYLMGQYENVYADLSGSAFNSSDAGADAYAKLVQQAFDRYKTVPKRVMYGSDFWLNRFFDGGSRYLETFKTSFTRIFPGKDDLLADVLGRNALRFLGFTREGGGRAPNGDRLAQAYRAAGQPLPSWLGT